MQMSIARQKLAPKFVPKFTPTVLGTVLGIGLSLSACTNGPPPPPGWPGYTTSNDSYVPLNTAQVNAARAYAPPLNANGGCARAEDLRAVKAAVIKQRLMVAGYSCQASDSYNDFVRAYRSDLQASDSDLQDFFTRLHGSAGERALDSFKTRIANSSMSDSLANTGRYCADARARFYSAMSPRRQSLDNFLAAQTINATERFTPCDMTTASTIR
jgi:hypothetical protein